MSNQFILEKSLNVKRYRQELRLSKYMYLFAFTYRNERNKDKEVH